MSRETTKPTDWHYRPKPARRYHLSDNANCPICGCPGIALTASAGSRVTRDYYISGGNMLNRVMEDLPRPAAFLERTQGATS